MQRAAPSRSQGDVSSGDASLLESIDLSQTTCLNESSEHGIKTILASKKKNTSGAYLLSDADEQLLVNISFSETVRVRSIVIQSTNGSHAPKDIKILVNRPSVGFEDVEDAKEPEIAQVLILSEDQVTEGKPVSLRFVRFQTVNSLHIFVASNHGGEDETRIDAIDIIGTSVQTTKDLSGLKKQEE